MIDVYGWMVEDVVAILSASVAIVTTVLMVVVSLAVCIVFRRGFWFPQRHDRTPANLMRHGVFWAFASDALNAAFWGQKWLAVIFGLPELASFVSAYGGFADPLTKGPTIWAGACHLVAAHALGFWVVMKLRKESDDA